MWILVMINTPFSGAKLKIARGRQHLAELEAEIANYVDRDPVFLLSIMNNKTKNFAITMVFREDIPSNIPMIFGDAVHNFRVALDILANDVATLSGAQPKKVYFPFAESREALEEQIKSKMRGVASDVTDLIRAIKPYRGGNDLLRALHDLDIIDKHVAVLQAMVGAASPALPVVQMPSDRPNRLTIEMNFRALPTTPIDPAELITPIRDDYEIVGRVVGSERARFSIAKGLPLAGMDPIEALDKLAALVGGIVQTFEARFPGP